MFMRFLFPLFLLLGLCLHAAAQKIDTLLLNGKIVTADTRGTTHEALAVGDGRIVALGTSNDLRRLASLHPGGRPGRAYRDTRAD